ncbi:MAG: energy transducer TonB [Caulobacterales bacterium]|nr:energy transducer TonB [Caulobacterales bacterium]
MCLASAIARGAEIFQPVRMRFAIAALALILATPAHAQVQPVPWAEQQPTDADYRRVYPVRAMRDGIEGSARLICTVTPDRTLDCMVANETPIGAGFGPAALTLSRKYVVNATYPGAHVGARVAVPIRFVLY